MTGLVLFFRLSLLLLAIVLCPAGKALAADQAYTKTVVNYDVPDVTLVNQDGVKVQLNKMLTSDKPVLVDFVYTTCTTICPVLSANFTNFQRKLGPNVGTVQLVSITIDPDNDTPRAMKSYLKRYYAKPGWDFLTGSRENVDKALRALNAYVETKMDHIPLILMKHPSDKQWVRIYGLISTADLMKEYERMKK